MAKQTKVVTTLIDDLDGAVITDAGQTVSFALDGVQYEIDLSSDNAAKLRAALAPYTAVARSSRRAGTPSRGSNKAELGAAREWLRSQGHHVSERGRIAANLLDLYRNKR
ncbi:MAG TPA: Lsr2 family protein [Candidatus Lumbricidophila sp.]|nr:Lsr2 family protein [Candidatus Lumbricidophila sp.]